MPRAKQLTLTVPDRPGMLGDIASALGAKKVNIVGVCGATTGGGGMIWMVVDKTAAAKKVLAQNGWPATEDEVLAVTLSDTPGALGRYATKLGQARGNISFPYTGPAATARNRRPSFVV